MTSKEIEGLRRLRALVNDDLYKLVEPNDRAAVIGWGTAFNVIHFVDGMIQLHAAGNCFAAGPIRRTALEYATATVWLADARDDAADALNSGLRFKMESLLKGMTDAGALERFPDDAVKNAETISKTELPKASQSNLLHIGHLLDEYDGDAAKSGRIPLRLIYDTESSFAHFSLMGARAFFKEEGDAVALGTMPEPDEFVPCLTVGLAILFTTMQSFNELLIGKPWTDALVKIASEHGIDPTLPKRRVRPAKEKKPGRQPKNG